MGIYSHNSAIDAPGDLLGVSTYQTAPGSFGNLTFSIPHVSIQSGETYWIAVAAVGCVAFDGKSDTSNPTRHKSSSDMPSPWGVPGFSTNIVDRVIATYCQ